MFFANKLYLYDNFLFLDLKLAETYQLRAVTKEICA